ncbi:hypothetical protein AAHE18_02G119200 [Arachis hypogaea]
MNKKEGTAVTEGGKSGLGGCYGCFFNDALSVCLCLCLESFSYGQRETALLRVLEYYDQQHTQKHTTLFLSLLSSLSSLSSVFFTFLSDPHITHLFCLFIHLYYSLLLF